MRWSCSDSPLQQVGAHWPRYARYGGQTLIPEAEKLSDPLRIRQARFTTRSLRPRGPAHSERGSAARPELRRQPRGSARFPVSHVQDTRRHRAGEPHLRARCIGTPKTSMKTKVTARQAVPPDRGEARLLVALRLVPALIDGSQGRSGPLPARRSTPRAGQLHAVGLGGGGTG